MKQIYLLFFIAIFTFGCSSKNGFSYFDLNVDEQRWENNRITATITQNEKVIGTVTAVYLNRAIPKLYSGAEYFFVALYTKEDINETQCFLNTQPSLLQEQIKDMKEFENYTQHFTKWDKLYIVGFSEVKDTEVLRLVVKNKNYSSTPLVFKKSE